MIELKLKPEMFFYTSNSFYINDDNLIKYKDNGKLIFSGYISLKDTTVDAPYIIIQIPLIDKPIKRNDNIDVSKLKAHFVDEKSYKEYLKDILKS